MPLYDFRCPQCEKEFESLSKPNDPVVCRHCSALGAERVYVATRFKYQIKGNNECSTPKRLKMEGLKVV